MKNNLFYYATSELSQDAFICWALNWFNIEPEDAKTGSLHQMASDILGLLGADQLEKESKIIIKRQYCKIDVLVIMQNSHRAYIIEDKTFTSEHDDQIQVYKGTIDNLKDEDISKLGLSGGPKLQVHTVYFKTGFFYDYDKRVKADRVIHSDDLLSVLRKYCGISEILDDYYDNLVRLNNWYSVHGDFTGTDPETNTMYVMQDQIAQYQLMRFIFPEISSVLDYGSSYGRPWTELKVFSNEYPQRADVKEKRKYQVFWRIDSDNKGPYLSLRFYDKYDKKDSSQKDQHAETYQNCRNIIREILKTNAKDYQHDIQDRYGENYFEATLLHIHLDRILKQWETDKDNFKTFITKITEEFFVEMSDLCKSGLFPA